EARATGGNENAGDDLLRAAADARACGAEGYRAGEQMQEADVQYVDAAIQGSLENNLQVHAHGAIARAHAPGCTASAEQKAEGKMKGTLGPGLAPPPHKESIEKPQIPARVT